MISAQRVYTMLGNSALWETARVCHAVLTRANFPHAIADGVAVCLHGYQRNTIDLDLLVRADDQQAIRELFTAEGFRWDQAEAEFHTNDGVPVQFLLAGDRAGRGAEVLLPDPASRGVAIEKEGLRLLSLARLIETKLACGQGNLRRTHKDFADVVELIIRNELTSAYARYLHKSLRKDFRELAHAANGG